MKIKICGLFREEDIDYVNEAGPDYIGFVFAQSRRRVSPETAARLRRRLAGGIIPVGVFVDAPVEYAAALYREGVIAAAQLHGGEDGAYIERLRGAAKGPIPVIRAIQSAEWERLAAAAKSPGPGGGPGEIPDRGLAGADYCLIDSGAGSGKTFDWAALEGANVAGVTGKPWFLAGGVGLDNIERALALKPQGIDISSGAETEGIKDREKIVALTARVRKADAHG
ncbi:MAG: phosphoribosylanthranilate isomerase [Treponema sp.]|jgi:phosphoribosylanthranilate isomerase|nr:phosphoribosylanthranilate isomerase [Treponema sp.]